MAEFAVWIKDHLPTQRRLIQLYSALLYNAHLKGFISGNIYTGKTKFVCVPGFNCYSCPGAVGACPLGALQNALASSGKRAPSYILGILLLYGLILGRSICGWLCPAGLLQELLHKIPSPKLKKSRVTRVLSYLKYVILAVFVVALPLWYTRQELPLPAFCKYICPVGSFEGAVGLLSNPANSAKFSMLGILFTRKFIILLIIVCACVFVYRAFCRFICPLGAIYGLFARFCIIGVKVNDDKCIHCGKCVSHCGMDVRRVGDHECINCGECMSVCPTKAISIKAGKVCLASPESVADEGAKLRSGRNRAAAWLLALAVLAGALWYFNHTDSSPNALDAADSSVSEAVDDSVDESIPVGKEPGMRAPDFSAPLYLAEGDFTLSEHRGKTVIVNFWATWCTPCVAELPHFNRLFLEKNGELEIVAIHSSLVTDDVEAYLSKCDYSMPFAHDQSGDIISSFGGSTMLPHTVIIDPEGIIVYNSTGSLSYEKLESLLP